MEELVLNSYCSQRKKISLRHAIRSFTKVQLVTLIVMIISAVIEVLVSFDAIENIWLMYIAVGIMTICYIILSKSERKINLENSDELFEKMEKKYREQLEWLKNIGYGEEKQIKRLCFRCEKYAEQLKKVKEKREKNIYTVVTILWVPIFIVIVTWLLGLEGNALEKVSAVIILTSAVTVMYMAIEVLIDILPQIFGDKECQMKLLINDLHGILDRCFEIDENNGSV